MTSIRMTERQFRNAELEFVHYNYGDGKGALEIKHLPTGLVVRADTDAGPVVQVQRQMLLELHDRLASHAPGQQGSA
jgi:hypothetical protein